MVVLSEIMRLFSFMWQYRESIVRARWVVVVPGSLPLPMGIFGRRPIADVVVITEDSTDKRTICIE